jgi:hypothetical protein
LDYFAPIILPIFFGLLLSGSYSLATHSLARFSEDQHVDVVGSEQTRPLDALPHPPVRRPDVVERDPSFREVPSQLFFTASG